jgi:hypothetical protein
MATLAELQEQRAELAIAINSGALRVSYNGRSTEYRSLEQMRSILARLDERIAAQVTPGRRRIRVLYTPGMKHL